MLCAAALAFFVVPSNAQWTNSGSYIYPTPSDPKVGIGTSTPNAQLHIFHATLPKFTISALSATGNLFSGNLALSTCLGCWSDFSTPGDFILRPEAEDAEDVIVTARSRQGAVRFGVGSRDSERMRIWDNSSTVPPFTATMTDIMRDMSQPAVLPGTLSNVLLRFYQKAGGGSTQLPEEKRNFWMMGLDGLDGGKFKIGFDNPLPNPPNSEITQFTPTNTALTIDRVGNVGIGVNPDANKVKIMGKNDQTGLFVQYNPENTENILGGFGMVSYVSGVYPWKTKAFAVVNGLTTGWNEVFVVSGTGDCQIGGQVRISDGVGVSPLYKVPQSHSDYRLAVNGKIVSKEVVVTIDNWADFVFGENYQLPTLSDVERHIKEKKHLPNIPSEAEVKQGGVNVGEMQAKLLQKVEELTLYLIQLQKENTELRSKFEAFQQHAQGGK